MIRVENDGPRLVSTNYWTSDAAGKGYLFISWNAGCCRVLVPDSAASMIEDMRSAREVIVTRGPWPEQGRDEALELLFEDDTDTPFAVHLVPEQSDRLVPAGDQGGGLCVAVYTASGLDFERPGRYRVMPSIPCLQPWLETVAARSVSWRH